MLLLMLNVTVILSPATLRSSLASVPCTSSSQPPDTWGSALCFWIFFSSLISSARNCAKALSPSVWRPPQPQETPPAEPRCGRSSAARPPPPPSCQRERDGAGAGAGSAGPGRGARGGSAAASSGRGAGRAAAAARRARASSMAGTGTGRRGRGKGDEAPAAPPEEAGLC